MPGDVRLVVAGRERSDWTGYTIDSDLAVPADAFQLSLGNFRPGFLAEIRSGDECQVYVHNQLVMTGLIDAPGPHRSKRSRRLGISGRDLAGLLVRHEMEPAIWKGLALDKVAAMVTAPLGLTRIEVWGVELLNPIKEVQVNPGQRAWDLLSDHADRQGVGIWMEPDGLLVIGRPRPVKPIGRLLDFTDPKKSAANNVLSLDPSESALGLYGRVVVFSQAQGNQWWNRTPAVEIRAEVVNPEITGRLAALTRVIRDDDVLTQDEAQNLAERRMAEGIRKSQSLTARVPGHLAPNGKVWKPGWLVDAESDDLGINRSYLILGRTLEMSRNGAPTTELRLVPPGSWP